MDPKNSDYEAEIDIDVNSNVDLMSSNALKKELQVCLSPALPLPLAVGAGGCSPGGQGFCVDNLRGVS